ncbi:MAG TPA: HD domain-containing protein, partial [Candidatus Wirthbacteria bacterium]|nr:HD domain-containing protein [Candidatus Wirthbacteria bacterium]
MSNLVTQRDIVLLAGFLHDIGKAIQRGSSTTGKHPEVGRTFLMDDEYQKH